MQNTCIITTIIAWGKPAFKKQLKTFADNNNNINNNNNNRATDFINKSILITLFIPCIVMT